MNYKALAYFVLILFVGVTSLFFFFNSFSKEKKNKLVSGKWSFLIGMVLLAVTVYTGIDFVHRVYEKMKTTVVSLKNFPETVDTENSNDTTNYVRALKKYEPEKYKGKVPEQYYSYYGVRDWWRFPLVYPYSISCIDKLDYGQIANDSGKTNFEEGGGVITASPSFDSLTFDANYFAGSIYQEKKSGLPQQYFIFDFKNGKKENILDKKELQKKFDEIKFTGDRKFISVKEYSERF